MTSVCSFYASFASLRYFAFHLVLFCVLSPSIAHAYDWRDQWVFAHETGETFVAPPVFADEAALYAQPSDVSAPLRRLPPGSSVRLEAPVRPESHVGHWDAREATWWIASHTDSTGNSVRGYLHHDVLALLHHSAQNRTFAIGWSSPYREYHPRALSVKVFENGAVITREELWIDPVMAPSFIRVESFRQLENLSLLVRTGIGAEQCGYPHIEYLFGWNGQRLLPLPTLISLGGEGMGPDYSESFHFPSRENGNTFVKVIRRYTPASPEQSQGSPAIEEETAFDTMLYLWDGQRPVASPLSVGLHRGTEDIRTTLPFYIDDAGRRIKNLKNTAE